MVAPRWAPERRADVTVTWCPTGCRARRSGRTDCYNDDGEVNERRDKNSGYKRSLDLALDNLGWAALLQGDHDRSRPFYEESLVVCKDLGDKAVASESLDGMACVAGTKGGVERAARLFGAARALRETLREAVAFQRTPEEEATPSTTRSRSAPVPRPPASPWNTASPEHGRLCPCVLVWELGIANGQFGRSLRFPGTR